jgi:hypothetical protein
MQALCAAINPSFMRSSRDRASAWVSKGLVILQGVLDIFYQKSSLFTSFLAFFSVFLPNYYENHQGGVSRLIYGIGGLFCLIFFKEINPFVQKFSFLFFKFRFYLFT